ncbi:MAG: hypothetical protein ABI639_11400 [Thermoanaerobaculia bacterium]
MTRRRHESGDDSRLIEAALQSLVPELDATANLPAAELLLSRARLRTRQLAAQRISRWHYRVRVAATAALAVTAGAISFATRARWTAWLFDPWVGVPTHAKGGGAPLVLAGALLATSFAAVWVLQQFAEE